MNKLINGEVVQLSPEEEAAVITEWAAAEAALHTATEQAKGVANFRAKTEREAQDLEAAGDTIGAVLLRLKHKL